MATSLMATTEEDLASFLENLRANTAASLVMDLLCSAMGQEHLVGTVASARRRL